MKQNKYSACLFRFLLYVSIFLSGGSALIYQVVWTRQCMLLLGSTAYAVGTVLSIFFLGLGLGSFFGGKVAERTLNPMRWYAWIEILTGLWALIVIDVVSNKSGIALYLIRLLPDKTWFLFLARISIAIFWFVLPSLCMGMTFPLLVRYEPTLKRKTRRYVSFLYFVNTTGAVLGAFFAGFVFIPNSGYTVTFYIAIGMSLGIGVIAWFISQFQEAIITQECNDEESVKEIEDGKERKASEKVIFLGVFLSGFVCLALEVLWTRLFIMIFLGTNYAYTSVLISVLAGISIGALCVSILINKFPLRMGILGWGYSLTGFGVLLTLIFISNLPQWMNRLQLEGTDQFYYGILGKFLLAFLILLIPMIGFGFTFPYALTLLRHFKRKSVVPSIGLAYGLNTIGSILGSLAGGFVVIPLLGCEKGVTFIGILIILSGFLFAFIDRKYHWTNLSFLLVFLSLFLVENVMEKINRYYLPEQHHLLFFSEGTEGTVAVSSPEKRTPEDERVLWINRVQATTAVERGVRMNRFQGIIPWMFNRNPQQVLFMCFGSGITCGTLGIGGFKHVDAVEISPEVLDAGDYFKDLNFNVMEMDNVRIYVDDARNFLIRSGQKYDFITTEPMPLAMAGVSMFYTQEFYQFCLQRLNNGGMISQWVPFHSSSEEIVQSAVYTFLKVFPYAVGLFVNADLFLVGSNSPLLLNPEGLEQVLRQNTTLKEAILQAGFPDIEEIMACFVMDRRGLENFSEQGKIITDGFPWVEFIAPQYVYNRKSVPQNLKRLKQCVSEIEHTLLPGSTENLKNSIKKRYNSHKRDLDGLMLYYEGLLVGDEVRENFIESLKIDRNNKQSQYYLRTISKTQIEQYIRWGEKDKAKRILEEVTPYLEDDPQWQKWQRQLQL